MPFKKKFKSQALVGKITLTPFWEAQGSHYQHYQDWHNSIRCLSQGNASGPVETSYSNQMLGTIVERYQNAAQ